MGIARTRLLCFGLAALMVIGSGFEEIGANRNQYLKIKDREIYLWPEYKAHPGPFPPWPYPYYWYGFPDYRYPY